MNNKVIIDQIKTSGIKATHQRIVIYNYVVNTKSHPSAENVFEAIKTEIPSISLGTVYKTLETFSEVGLIKRVMNAETPM